MTADGRRRPDNPAGQGAKRGTVLTSLELFTGGGGLAIAMAREKFRHLLAVENDPRACATLIRNSAVSVDPDDLDLKSLIASKRWPLAEHDVRTIDYTNLEGAVDVAAGGVPCQPWSLGGAHKGYEDDRNLWPELFRCVRESRPRAIVAENVRGLLRPSFKPYYEYILHELGAPFERRLDGEDWVDHERRLVKTIKAGGDDPTEHYDVKYKLVNAADYGVPQVRWRVFVVAFRKDLGLENWDFPTPTHSEAALKNDQAAGRYWARHGLEASKGKGRPQGEDSPTKAWRTLRDAWSDLPEPLGDKIEHPDWLHHVRWPGAREYAGHTANALDRPGKTIKAGVHGVAGGETVVRLDDESIRYMTVREAARVMTFPDAWELDGPRGVQMRQLGNAVPVDLGRAVAKSVREALSSVDSSRAC
jgi:DNA (cytosine-5)-methyltransferase 1